MEPFISTGDLENYLGQTVTTDSAVIAIDAACEVVRGYINQTINLVEDDEVFLDGTGRPGLLLPELPVVSIAEVTTYDRNGEDETSLIEGTDFKVGGSGILWRIASSSAGSPGYRWPPGHANILVVYTHGWAVTDLGSGTGTDTTDGVPSDIRRIALGIAARDYTMGAKVSAGIRSETISATSYSYTLGTDAGSGSGGLQAGEQRILDRYRQKRLA